MNQPTKTVTPTEENATAAQQWQAESDFCGLLSRLWIQEVDQATLALLREPASREAYLRLGGHVPEDTSVETLESLAIEYCACFLGPRGHLPPHQSVVAQSRFQGSVIDSLNQFVDLMGSPEGLVAEQRQPDHAGVILALWQGILLARAQADEADERSLAELQDAFARLHLAWLIDYCQAALRREPGYFYGGLFTVTLAYLNSHFGLGANE